MDADQVKKWQLCEKKARDNGLVLTIKSTFALRKYAGQMLGTFSTVDELFCFLCGYEWGWSGGATEVT
jgi:hypothetical protein